MSDRVLVMVSDLDDVKHGEISLHENPHAASKAVEKLLEAGFPQARIRVFSGDEMGMQIAHRPVVALMSGDDALDGPTDHADDKQPVTSR